MRFLIRPAVAADVPFCAAMLVVRDGGSLRARMDLFRQDLDDPDRYVTVAEVGGAVIGYGRTMRFQPEADAPAGVAPAGYYLSGLYVTPTWRRNGVGEALTRHRMAWVAERAPEVWYFANARNDTSIRLHQRLGFAEVTRDFVFPGVTFSNGQGVLFRARLAGRAG